MNREEARIILSQEPPVANDDDVRCFLYESVIEHSDRSS